MTVPAAAVQLADLATAGGQRFPRERRLRGRTSIRFTRTALAPQWHGRRLGDSLLTSVDSSPSLVQLHSGSFMSMRRKLCDMV